MFIEVTRLLQQKLMHTKFVITIMLCSQMSFFETSTLYLVWCQVCWSLQVLAPIKIFTGKLWSFFDHIVRLKSLQENKLYSKHSDLALQGEGCRYNKTKISNHGGIFQAFVIIFFLILYNLYCFQTGVTNHWTGLLDSHIFGFYTFCGYTCYVFAFRYM